MNPTVRDKRSTLPTILTTYQPIEEFWNSFVRTDALERDLERVLNPFDAFLTHLVLDLAPGLPLLVDLAVEATAGTSSLIGLTHPHVRRVVAISDEGTAPADRTLSALRMYLRGRPPGHAPFDVIPRTEMPAGLSDQTQVVILADARGGSAEGLANGIRLWLDELPDALVLILGLGRVGECPAVESLLRLCATDSGRRFWLMRELEEVFASSDLGMVARHDRPQAAEILLRIRLLHASNYHYLDLLKSLNQAAMQAARVDDEVFHSHPLSGPWRAEVDALRRAAQESKARADAADRALAATTAELDKLRWEYHVLRERPVLRRVRRKLAQTILGKVWRLAKRVVRKGRS